MDFLLRHQQLDARPTNHGLRCLTDVVQFFESEAEAVSIVEEAHGVVADEGPQSDEQFPLALSYGGNRVNCRMSDMVLGSVQRRLKGVSECQLFTDNINACLAVVQQRVKRASMAFQTISQ